MKYRQSLAILLALFVALPALPATAKRPRAVVRVAKAAPASKYGDPTKLPSAKAQQLVNAVRIPGFYDPTNLHRVPIVSAKAVAVMDAITGEILWTKNADQKLYPASTTKIMTGLLLAEKTEPTDVITCLNTKIRDIEASSLHIQPWEKFTSRDLLYGTMLRSANDGSVVIAEHISGSVAKFSELMNQRAAEAGATNTHFNNPNGLPDKEHYTTAHDLAFITRDALANERFRDAVKIRKRTIERTKSMDKVVASKAKKFYETFPGADGVKTGYTRAARHCFVGSATRNGRQLIGVVLGASDNASGETATVLGWAFRRFPTVIAMKSGESAPPVAVTNGAKSSLQTIAGADLVTFKDAMKDEAVVQTVAEPIAGLTAPIGRGQEVGRLIARVNGVDRGSVPLLADEDIPVAPVVAVTRHAGSVLGTVGKIALWAMGAGAVFLIGLACYGTATTKSARRRRNHLAPQGRGVDFGRPRQSERRDNNGSGVKRGPGDRRDHR